MNRVCKNLGVDFSFKLVLSLGVFVLLCFSTHAQLFTLRISAELDGKRISDAVVVATHTENGHTYAFELDSVSKTFVSKEVEHGRVLVKVSAPNCETEERFLTIREDGKRRIQQRFVLGKKGSAFFYMDNMRFPFTEAKQMLLVKIREGQYTSLKQWANSNHLKLVEIPNDVGNVYGISGTSKQINTASCKLLASLRSRPWIEYAGVQIGNAGRVDAVLTNVVSVQLITSANLAEVEAYLKNNGLEVVDKLSDTNWQCKAADSSGYKLNAICKELLKNPSIEGVVPELRELFFVGED